MMSKLDWKALDKRTLGIIRLFLSSSVAFNISEEKTTEDLMIVLYRMYEKPLVANKVFLM